MSWTHHLARWTSVRVLLPCMFILCGMVGASAEETLIRKIGTRVECFDPDLSHPWDESQRALAEQECSRESGGSFYYSKHTLHISANTGKYIEIPDDRASCDLGDPDKCSWVTSYSFDLIEEFLIAETSFYECYYFDFVNMNSLVRYRLWERPIFSLSGNRFVVVRGEQNFNMTHDIEIYSVDGGDPIAEARLKLEGEAPYHVWFFKAWIGDDTVVFNLNYNSFDASQSKEAEVTVKRQSNGSWELVDMPNDLMLQR